MADEFQVEFSSTVDLTGARKSIYDFKQTVENGNGLYNFKLQFGADFALARNDIKNFKEQIKNEIGKDTLQCRIDLKDSLKQFNDYKKSLNDLLQKRYTLNIDINRDLERTLERISQTVENIRRNMNAVNEANGLANTLNSISGRDNNISQAETQLNRLFEQLARIEQTANSTTMFNDNGLDVFDEKVRTLTATLNELRETLQNVQSQREGLPDNLSGELTESEVQQVRDYNAAYRDLRSGLHDAREEMTLFSSEVNAANVASRTNFVERYEASIQSLNDYFRENEQQLRGFEDEFRNVEELMRDSVNVTQLNAANEAFRNLRTNVADTQRQFEATMRAMSNEEAAQQKAFDVAKQQYDKFQQTQMNMLLDIEKYLSVTKSVPQELEQEFVELSKSIINANRYADFGDFSRQFDALKTQVKVFNNDLKESVKVAKDLDKSALFDSSKANSLAKLSQYMNENTRVTINYREELEKIKVAMENATNTTQLAKANKDFNTLKTNAKEVGNQFNSLGDVLKKTANQFAYMVSIAYLLRKGFSEIKEGISTIIGLDDAMVELKKVTTETSDTYNEFYNTINKTAKQLGTTTEEAIQAVSSFSQMGYSLKEAKELAKNASILATISPEMTVEQSTDAMVSIIKAYGIEVKDTLDGIASKVNYVGKILPPIHYIG